LDSANLGNAFLQAYYRIANIVTICSLPKTELVVFLFLTTHF